MNVEKGYGINYMGMSPVSHLDSQENKNSKSSINDSIGLHAGDNKENYSVSSYNTKCDNNFNPLAKSPQTKIPDHYYLFSPLKFLKGHIAESEMNIKLDSIAKKMNTDFATVKILALQYVDGINPDDDFDCSNL